MDRLEQIFWLQESFMKVLSDNKEKLPEWPVDPSDKKAQQFIRDIIHRGTEEAFEALLHLKNWKPHRQTEITEFDRGEFLEEIVDAFNYFLSILVLTGFSADDLMEAYRKKDEIINSRLETGY